MRAVELQGPGIESLALVERPVPEPGPGEVVLRMRAASLNFRDLSTIRGVRPGVRYPAVPLSDGCGEVVAAGPGVTRVAVGDRVAPSFFPDWISGPPPPEAKDRALGSPLDGCLQEYLRIGEQGVTRAPEHLSDEEVASLPCAALTAWRALVVEGRARPGERVLVQGTGGVSIFALQFAKLLGCEVVLTSSSDEKLERGRALGADHCINYRTHPDWPARVREATGGEGVDHALDVGGAGSLRRCLESTAVGGHVSVIGVLGGAEEPIPIRLLMYNNARLTGITVGSRSDFEQMCRAIELHRLRPQISDVFEFDDYLEALKLMERGGHFGKICIRIPA